MKRYHDTAERAVCHLTSRAMGVAVDDDAVTDKSRDLDEPTKPSHASAALRECLGPRASATFLSITRHHLVLWYSSLHVSLEPSSCLPPSLHARYFLLAATILYRVASLARRGLVGTARKSR